MESGFQMPKQVKITNRISSITNSFINGIIPVVHPSPTEIDTALKKLGMNESDVRCVYCGDASTEWDHLRPLVKNKKPTGFISEISNLVPACGKCNQSKGNKDWEKWMRSGARLSPKTRNIPDLEKRIQVLREYAQWKQTVPLKFEDIVDTKEWDKHWENYDRIVSEMKESQLVAENIRIGIKEHYEAKYR